MIAANERFFAVVMITTNDETGEAHRNVEFVCRDETTANEAARNAAANDPGATYLVMTPGRAYRAKPREADAIYLEWPAAEAAPAPTGEA